MVLSRGHIQREAKRTGPSAPQEMASILAAIKTDHSARDFSEDFSVSLIFCIL